MFDTMAGNVVAQQYHQTGDFSMVLSVRTVQLYYEISGECLGVRFRIPRQWAWGHVVGALHYYAARQCGVPVWCIRLKWPSNPWDLTQLSLNLRITCTVSNDFSHVDCFSVVYDRDDVIRCECCWEDCEDAEEIRMSRENICASCLPSFLCDRCRIQMPDGLPYCMWCVVAERDSGEDDGTYDERVDAVLRLLVPLQRMRWVSVQAIANERERQNV